MKYLHVEIFLGSGLSDQDLSDYFACCVPERFFDEKDKLYSLLLLNYLLHNKKINLSNIKIIELKNSKCWLIEDKRLLSNENLINIDLTNLEELPLFFMAMNLEQILTIGKVQELSEEAFSCLKDLFVNFTIQDSKK